MYYNADVRAVPAFCELSFEYPYMDISDLKKLKKEAGLTNAEIAELSGIPVSTVNKIFSGATKNPRYAAMLAIEQVLTTKEKIPFTYDKLKEEPAIVRDAAAPYMYSAREYGGEDIEKLSEWSRAELINGRLFQKVIHPTIMSGN